MKKFVIPRQAKRVFKGVIFDTYHWQQKMFDGSYKTFEKLRRPDTVEVIAVTNDKKIIVLYQRQPVDDWFYCLPGGQVDKNEKPLSASQRELIEETGFQSKNFKLLNKHQVYSNIDWHVYLYLAKKCQKSAEQNLDVGEKIIVKKFNFNQFLKLVDQPDFRCSKWLMQYIYQCRLDKKKRKAFYKMLFI